VSEITNEMLYAELLRIDERLTATIEDLQDLASFMKEANRELNEGRARTEALKKALFGNRLEVVGDFSG